MNTYPMLDFIGKHGGWFAVLLGALPLLGTVLLLVLGFSPWWLAVGACASAIAYVLARSYVELVRVMIDMLLPK
jgi:hypothetical protein